MSRTKSEAEAEAEAEEEVGSMGREVVEEDTDVEEGMI